MRILNRWMCESETRLQILVVKILSNIGIDNKSLTLDSKLVPCEQHQDSI